MNRGQLMGWIDIMKIPAVAAACSLLCLLTILVAGLWPFGSPSNEVEWVADHDGLRFGQHATAFSTGPLADPGSAACTVELRVVPGMTDDSGTLLSFYDGPSALSIGQSLTDLQINQAARRGPRGIYFDNVFHKDTPLDLAIVFDKGATSIYVNRSLAQRSRRFAVSSPCTGRFVVGDSASAHNSWRGEIDRLAIYRGVLAQDQVNAGDAALPIADVLYHFDEHRGRSVVDHGQAGVKLLLPERYQVVHQILLEAPWEAFEPSLGYVTDLVINVAGFLPLGFAICALVSARTSQPGAGRLALILGFFVSLTIEVLQSYLPTRNSDLTDVVTNTLGTALGVTLCRRMPGLGDRKDRRGA